jgi:type IV pilus assembly protein PilO
MARINAQSLNVDFAELQQKVAAQFQNLDPQDPSSWPVIPRVALFVAVAVGVLVLSWFLLLSDAKNNLEQERATEQTLREDYKTKLAKAVNLDVLRKQREQVEQYVTQLEKQLPSRAEMDALLQDISQAVTSRSLKNELFRPGQVNVKEYYAELPIELKLSGTYHDMGSFASDIANLSRIVTLNNISIAPLQDGRLAMDAVAKTFRYLDDEEISSQRNANKKGAK